MTSDARNALSPPSAPARPAPQPRSAYRAFRSISTRWADNDVYGHVNNVVYYSWFDTVVNEYLIRRGVLDIEGSAVIGVVVETQCRYFSELAFPQPVDLGLRVGRLGTSSVRYEIGVFADGEPTASACSARRSALIRSAIQRARDHRRRVARRSRSSFHRGRPRSRPSDCAARDQRAGPGERRHQQRSGTVKCLEYEPEGGDGNIPSFVFCVHCERSELGLRGCGRRFAGLPNHCFAPIR